MDGATLLQGIDSGSGPVSPGLEVAPNSDQRRAGPKRVLVVDRDPGVALSLKLLFSHSGCDCQVVESGEKAIALAAEWLPDTAVVDFILADMLGIKAADQLSERHRCQIIMIHAQINPDLITHAEQKGYTVFTKPVHPGILLQCAGVLPMTGQPPTAETT